MCQSALESHRELTGGQRGFQFLKENTVKFRTLNKLLVHVNSQITLHDIIHMFVKRWFLAFGFCFVLLQFLIKILFGNQHFLYYLKIFERFFSENQYGEENVCGSVYSNSKVWQLCNVQQVDTLLVNTGT